MNKTIGYLAVLLTGIGIGFGMLQLTGHKDVVGDDAEEPIYWVAPMDASYRRDKPGKSPMGMDLVPVFADETSGAGTIKVSPAVEHNLGVRTAFVRRGLMKDSITTFAVVHYNEDLMVNIYPRVEGWIEKLFVKSEGEAITKGQALYEFYSPELVNAQEEFLAALRQGNQVLAHSARERLASLSVPESIVSSIEKQRTVQRNVTIYATQSGVVVKLEVREGNFVKRGNQIMSIAGLSSVWVTADVFENDVSGINVGDAMLLKFDYLPGKVTRSTLDFIYPAVDPMVRTLRVRSTVNNEDGSLRPNMFAKATIQLTDDKLTTLVPVEAVIRTGSKNKVVLVSGPGEYKSIEIELGRVSRTEVEILHGLNPGDEIVTQSQFLLDSESSVTSDFKRMENFNALGSENQSSMQMDMPDRVDGEAGQGMDRTEMSMDQSELSNRER